MVITPSMRLIFALIFSTAAALAMGPLVLPVLRRLKAGQTIRAEMHAAHQAKAGTPTMGGLIFVIPAALATLLFAPREGDAMIRLIVAMILTLGHGAVGFADDYIKVVLKRSLGLRAREKLLAQVVLAAILGYAAVEVLHLGTDVWIPFADITLPLGKPLYYVLVYIAVGGFANAVNFTDGLDGLLAGCSIIVFTFYALAVCALKGQWDMATLSISLVGGCIGFLKYNSHPARVFMGDVGSFALGGALAALAILTRTEFLAVIVGGLFVVEMLSVVLQVASFKLTGKRIFKMAPIHHHFELLGWSEGKVLRWFWTTCLVLAGLAYLALPGWIIAR